MRLASLSIEPPSILLLQVLTPVPSPLPLPPSKANASCLSRATFSGSLFNAHADCTLHQLNGNSPLLPTIPLPHLYRSMSSPVWRPWQSNYIRSTRQASSQQLRAPIAGLWRSPTQQHKRLPYSHHRLPQPAAYHTLGTYGWFRRTKIASYQREHFWYFYKFFLVS